MATRHRDIREYEVVVKTGPSEFGWDSIKTYTRFGRWDADVEATAQRKANPQATVLVRRVTERKCA